jgi:hypothetical protein
MSTPAVPDSLAREVVVSPVYCRRCGYNLYGLRADGLCPECGLATWETILHTVDPAASRLPKLRNPVAVGNMLVGLTICLLAAAVALAVRPVALWIDALGQSGLRNFSAWTPVELGYVGGLAALCGIWFVWRLAPPRGEEPTAAVWRDVWWLGCGLGAWAILATAVVGLELALGQRWFVGLLRLAMAGAAIMGLIGLRGMLGVIGLRSREYRTARGGRQGIQAMVAAVIAAAAGQLTRLIAGSTTGGVEAVTIGTVITSISTLMLLIGLAYLVVNAWWIRRSLRRPPPRLDQILRPVTGLSAP